MRSNVEYYCLDKIINLQGDILGGPKVASIFSGTEWYGGPKGDTFRIFHCCFVMLLSLCIVVLMYCHIVVMLYCFLVVLASQLKKQHDMM